MLRKAKASYFTKLIEEAKGSSASLWKHLNKLTNKEVKHNILKELKVGGQPTTDSALIANEHNNFFIQSAEDLAQNFEHVTLNTIEMKDSPNSFYIREVDETKVREILKK